MNLNTSVSIRRKARNFNSTSTVDKTLIDTGDVKAIKPRLIKAVYISNGRASYGSKIHVDGGENYPLCGNPIASFNQQTFSKWVTVDTDVPTCYLCAKRSGYVEV